MAAKPPTARPAPPEWPEYKRMPGLVLGFHGCDRSHGEAVLSSGKHLRTSSNSHDWLGEGIYFWENDPWRAHDWAWEAKLKPAQVAGSIDEPFVVGAIIDLGHCCNLLDLERSEELERAFNFISQIYAAAGRPMPENDLGPDRVRRYRDRIVVKAMHDLRREEGLTPFQSVRAAFFEGPELYENAGFRKKNHIQIAVCDPNCIKGYFRLPGL